MGPFGSAAEDAMGMSQLVKSVRRIAANPHVSTPIGCARHLQWQLRKARGGFPCELRLSRSIIEAPDPNSGVYALINSQGLYDYDNMKLFAAATAAGMTFFDIGANVGSYTLVASEPEDARCYAFEPHPATFSRLVRNLARNDRRNVHAEQLALGEQPGEIAFSDHPESSVNQQVAAETPNAIGVRCERADAFCEARGISADAVKIDVEGFEEGVLHGFGETLSRIRIVAVEANDRATAEARGRVAELLRGRGLKGPYWLDFDRRALLEHPGPLQQDPLFLRHGVLDQIFP